MLFIDRGGLIAFCSDTLLRRAGLINFSSIAGKPFQYLYAILGGEELALRGEAHYEKVKSTLEASEAEVHISFSKNSYSRVYNVYVTPMIDEGGQFDGALVTHYDTTEVRDTEADEYTRIMLDATPLACALWDENGVILDCNREKLRMFGLSTISEYVKYTGILSPAFQPDGSRSADTLLANKKRAFEEGYLRFSWVHKTFTGEPLPVESTFVRVPWKGRFRLATYLRDLRKLTETQRIAQKADARSREFETQMQAAMVASEAKSRFLASISHEIRTPMNAIIGMSDLMRTDNFDMTQKAFFDDIKKMSKSLLQIINDVLDFSRIEAGRLEIMPVHFNLLDMYHNICSMSRFLADSKGLYFTDSIDINVPGVIFGDDVRIRQVILNIINNSIKYTREGDIKFDVRREARDGRDYITFEIKDTGIGIKEEDLSKLFNAFYQVDMTVNRGIDGSGLGLSITRSLVSLMEGEIVISSVYGRGTDFKVLLPLVEGKPELVDNQAYSPYFNAGEARVLIVDDSQINLKVAAAYLEKFDIMAETALSGYEALVKIQKHSDPYDMVLMDHMMPGMDGIETTRKIRELGYTKLPIIALTANAVFSAREIYAEAGMNGFISKPIDSGELARALIRWLPAWQTAGAGQNRPYKQAQNRDPAHTEAELCSAEETNSKTGSIAVAETGSASDHASISESSPVTVPVYDVNDKIIDFDMGLSNAVNDCELYRKLLQDFISAHGLDYSAIKNAIDDEKPEAERLVHTLKGTSALIGANRLRHAAYHIEKALSEGVYIDMDDALYRLDAELTAVIDAIEQYADG